MAAASSAVGKGWVGFRFRGSNFLCGLASDSLLSRKSLRKIWWIVKFVRRGFVFYDKVVTVVSECVD